MGGGKLVWMFDGTAPANVVPPPPPPSLPVSGAVLWADASQLTGLSNADPVSSWTDMSGTGNHLTQATSSKRPTYRTNQINSLPIVRFDGIDDVLSTVAAIISTSWDVFVVFKSPTSTQSNTIWAQWQSGQANRGGALSHFDAGGNNVANDIGLFLENGGNQANAFSSGQINTTNFFLGEWQMNVSVSVLQWINGASVMDNTNVPGTIRQTPFTVGDLAAAAVLPGALDIAEVIAYTSALPTPNRILVNAYIATKYGLVVV